MNYGESASEVMILTAAAMALLECRSALVEGQEAARASHEKHGGFIARELAQALQTVGSYTTNEVILGRPSPFLFTPLFPLSPFVSSNKHHHGPLFSNFAVNDTQS